MNKLLTLLDNLRALIILPVAIGIVATSFAFAHDRWDKWDLSFISFGNSFGSYISDITSNGKVIVVGDFALVYEDDYPSVTHDNACSKAREEKSESLGGKWTDIAFSSCGCTKGFFDNHFTCHLNYEFSQEVHVGDSSGVTYGYGQSPVRACRESKSAMNKIPHVEFTSIEACECYDISDKVKNKTSKDAGRFECHNSFNVKYITGE